MAENMTENIVVYGAGAIGSQIAGRMHGAGHPVTVVEPWAPQREAMQQNGITVHNEMEGGPDEHYTPPTIAPDELDTLNGPIDVLFLCVKSFDTMASLDIVLPHLAPDGLVVSMQNSINEEWVAPRVGIERTVGGVILINAVLLEPGHVTLTSSVSRASAAHRDLPGVYVGEYLAPAGDKARRVAALLNSVWPSVPVDDLMHERWSKLANNTMMNTVSAISGLRSKLALGSPEARKLIVEIAAETLRVAEAEGYPLDMLMGDYSAEEIFAGSQGRSDSVDQGLAGRAALVSETATTSMLQDVLRSRQTEVDYFSGLIAEKGATHGIETPFCRAATQVAHRVEGGLEARVENIAEVFRLVGD
jgi:2-dehydropantoate 2-reductase